MITLRIEHKVPSYEGWKKVFDSDPINRKKSGVVHYRIYRMVAEPDYVMVDLEFNNVQQAQTALDALQKLWNRVEGTVISGPKAQFLEMVEAAQPG